jgi:ribosomal-protein-alanine N-acetyltransferase
MHISSMTSQEVDAVSALAEVCGFCLDIAEEHARRFAHIWVARLDPGTPDVDAFLLAWQAADEFDIIALAARQDVRRRGLARALMHRLLLDAASLGVRHVSLEVRGSNSAAIGLYRNLGFEVSRVRRGYYSGPVEDGLEMILPLASASQIRVAAEA